MGERAVPGRGRLVLLWLAGIDLRLTLLAVPPVLPLIHRDLGLDEKGVAAVSSLPVLLLGLAATPGSLLIARVGARRALLAGLLLIGVPSALRGAGPSAPLLFATTLLMGAGIAICQPTLPALVRQWYPTAVARATGVWSNGLLVGELLSASLTLPVLLPLVGQSWGRSFVVWAVPVLLTAGVVAASTAHDPTEAAYWRGSGVPDWRGGRVWQLGFLQASASLVYFGANTFIPDYLNATGRPDLVGLALAVLNTAQLPASLVIGLVPWRVLGRPVTSVMVAATILACLPALMSGQTGLAVAAAGVLGFCAAYILVVSFALPALLAAPTDVARLSAGMFTISYTTAFLANLLAGAVWDATRQAAAAFLPLLLGGAVVLVLGPRLVTAGAAAGPRPARVR